MRHQNATKTVTVEVLLNEDGGVYTAEAISGNGREIQVDFRQWKSRSGFGSFSISSSKTVLV